MAVSITICNLALGELRAQPLADIADETIEARECARYYPQCLRVLLERHDWSFADRRATLALLTTNDRPNEWGYAYALPADCAMPVQIVTDIAASRAYYWPYDWSPTAQWQNSFIVENRTLYSQIPDAILEYSTATIDDPAMSGLFVDALVYTLASRLATPLRDDRTIKGQLLQQAEIAFQRAVAADMNRQPQHDRDAFDEVSQARTGGATSWRFP
jgi:hypothetical protein